MDERTLKKKYILKKTNERLKLYISREKAKKRIKEYRALHNNGAHWSTTSRKPRRRQVIRDEDAMGGGDHEEVVKSDDLPGPSYSTEPKKRVIQYRGARNKRVHCSSTRRDPPRPMKIIPEEDVGLGCSNSEGEAKADNASQPGGSSDDDRFEDSSNINSIKLPENCLDVFPEGVTETDFVPVAGTSDDGGGLDKDGEQRKLSFFRRAVRKVKSVFSRKKSKKNRRHWSEHEPAFPFPTFKTSPFHHLPDFESKFGATVAPDPMSYHYVYRDGKPVVIDQGSYGCVYLVEQHQVFYALKVFRKESSSLYDVWKEVEVFQFANKKGIRPQFRGFFPLEENSILISWGILIDFAGSAIHKGQTLRQLLSEYKKKSEFTALTDREWLDVLINICEQVNVLNRAGVMLTAVSADNIVVIKANGLYEAQFLDFRDAALLKHNPCATYYGDFAKVRDLMGLINWETDSNERFHDARELMSQVPAKATWDDVIKILRAEKFFTRSIF